LEKGDIARHPTDHGQDIDPKPGPLVELQPMLAHKGLEKRRIV